MKTKLIFIDGPDDSGKTTLIETLKSNLPIRYGLTELKFNKGLNGLLRINTEEHFEILKSILPHLCKENVYITDTKSPSVGVPERKLELSSLRMRSDSCPSNAGIPKA